MVYGAHIPKSIGLKNIKNALHNMYILYDCLIYDRVEEELEDGGAEISGGRRMSELLECQ